MQGRGEFLPSGNIHVGFLHRLSHALLKLLTAQGCAGATYEATGGRKAPPQEEVVKSRHELAGGKVAGGPKNYYGTGI
jgi:hypothetical protein